MIRKTFLFSLLSILFLAYGCNDDELPFTDCFQEPKGDTNLNINVLEGPTVTLPSKVSVFFKLTDDNGNPVGYLTPDNFRIYEQGLNDQCHRIISKSEAERKISGKEQVFNHTTMLVLDLSGSVLQQDLEPLKNAAVDFIESIMPDTVDESTKMGIWWFDGEDELHELVPATSKKSDLNLGILTIDESISNDASTDLYGAVIKSSAKANELLSANPNDVIAAVSVVLFTDGRDRANRYLKADAQAAISNSPLDITYFTIGVGSEIDESELISFGRNGFVSGTDASQLSNIFENVAAKVGNEANSYYLFEYCSPIRSGTANGLIIEASYSASNSETKFGFYETTFDATGFGGGCQL